MSDYTPPYTLSNKDLAAQIILRWGLGKDMDSNYMLEAAMRLLSVEKREIDFYMKQSLILLETQKLPIRGPKTLARRK